MLALQTWTQALPIQQQSLLMAAIRGPDGIPREHPCKRLHACYRGVVLNAGKYGRPLRLDEDGDLFMNLIPLRSPEHWQIAAKAWFDVMDGLSFHYITHFTDAAEIIGYTHPDPTVSFAWRQFYESFCMAIHKTPETRVEMKNRLNDWGQKHWENV